MFYFITMADVGAVFHKLFDHRTAMHSEHQFFVKEFEVSATNATLLVKRLIK